jgi:hypothetical protein
MVNDHNQDTRRKPANQAVREVTPEPNKISASTPYDFEAKNLTAYGGLLPVASCWRSSASSNWWKKPSPLSGRPRP